MAIVPKSMHWKDKQEFHKSDIVRWKEALKRALPLRGMRCMYVAVMFSPIHAEKAPRRRPVPKKKTNKKTLHNFLLKGSKPIFETIQYITFFALLCRITVCCLTSQSTYICSTDCF